jgi:hypothetical protein
VEVFMRKLREEGILEGSPNVNPKGLPLPDGGVMVDLHVPESQVPTKCYHPVSASDNHSLVTRGCDLSRYRVMFTPEVSPMT